MLERGYADKIIRRRCKMKNVQKDGCTEGWMDRRTNRFEDGLTEGRLDIRMDVQKDGCTEGQMYRRTDGLKDG